MNRKKLILPLLLLFFLLLTGCGKGEKVCLHFLDGSEKNIRAESMEALLRLTEGAYAEEGDREGYGVFWFADSEGSRPLEEETEIPGELWQLSAPVSVRVTLDAAGGDLDVTGLTVRYDRAYGELPSPERDDFLFEGWYTEALGGDPVTSETVCSTWESHTLYAAWTPTRSLFLVLNSGTEGEDPVTLTYESGETFTIPETFTKEGFLLAGWSTRPDGGDFYAADAELCSPVPAGRTLTLYAVWKANPVTVTFDPMGGELDETTKVYSLGDPYGELPVPEKENCLFLGWFTDEACTAELGEDALVPTGDHTLYAGWLEDAFEITFDANGGSGEMDALTGQAGDEIELPDSGFTRSGYTFLGWSRTENGVADYLPGDRFSVEEAGEYTLYAVWKAGSGSGNTQSSSRKSSASSSKSSSSSSSSSSDEKAGYKYTVQYNANGGSGSTPSSEHVNGTPSALSSCGFTRSGYTFVGWSIMPDGSLLFFFPGDTISDMATKDGETITLYAIWESDGTTSGGSSSTSSQSEVSSSAADDSSTSETSGEDFQSASGSSEPEAKG